MENHKLRKEIRKILQSFFTPIEEAGGSLNNKFVYPYGMNTFPYDKKPKTPEELGMSSNSKFGTNSDDFEEYRNRDAVTVFPVFPMEESCEK